MCVCVCLRVRLCCVHRCTHVCVSLLRVCVSDRSSCVTMHLSACVCVCVCECACVPVCACVPCVRVCVCACVRVGVRPYAVCACVCGRGLGDRLEISKFEVCCVHYEKTGFEHACLVLYDVGALLNSSFVYASRIPPRPLQACMLRGI